jgi:flagellar M-ring protein FliF
MDLSISNLFQSIKGYLAKLSRGKKIAIVALLVSVLAGAIILANVLDNAGYTVLYRGLSASEGVEIVNLLDSMGTTYRLQTDGTILVPKSSEAMLKMQLAAEGFPKSTLGYDVFTSQSALMTTDYEKRQYLIFQLQDRLQESLKTLEGVKNAIVTLNVPDDNSFVLKADKPQASASVVLDLYSYTTLSDKQIRGIEALVSRSVPGLQNGNVAIVDSTGVVLNEKSEELSGQALSQIDAISKINEYYKKKITSFLEPVFGADGMSVAVNVQVDFQQRTSEKTTYAPVVGDTGILSKEDYDRQSINGGVVQNIAAGTNANTGTPTYVQNANGTNDQSASESGSNEYLVNKLIEGIEDNGGRITDMTVAVMINSSYLSDDLVKKYKEMVAYGVGIPVEKVVITQAEFTPKEPPALPQAQASNMDSLIIAIAGGFALLLALAVFFTLRAGRKKKRNMQHAQQTKGQQGQRQQQPGKRSGQEQQAEKPDVPGEIVLTETREQGIKRQVKEFASVNPEIVAQLIRTWMKEDDAK